MSFSITSFISTLGKSDEEKVKLVNGKIGTIHRSIGEKLAGMTDDGFDVGPAQARLKIIIDRSATTGARQDIGNEVKYAALDGEFRTLQSLDQEAAKMTEEARAAKQDILLLEESRKKASDLTATIRLAKAKKPIEDRLADLRNAETRVRGDMTPTTCRGPFRVLAARAEFLAEDAALAKTQSDPLADRLAAADTTIAEIRLHLATVADDPRAQGEVAAALATLEQKRIDCDNAEVKDLATPIAALESACRDEKRRTAECAQWSARVKQMKSEIDATTSSMATAISEMIVRKENLENEFQAISDEIEQADNIQNFNEYRRALSAIKDKLSNFSGSVELCRSGSDDLLARKAALLKRADELSASATGFTEGPLSLMADKIRGELLAIDFSLKKLEGAEPAGVFTSKLDALEALLDKGPASVVKLREFDQFTKDAQAKVAFAEKISSGSPSLPTDIMADFRRFRKTEEDLQTALTPQAYEPHLTILCDIATTLDASAPDCRKMIALVDRIETALAGAGTRIDQLKLPAVKAVLKTQSNELLKKRASLATSPSLPDFEGKASILVAEAEAFAADVVRIDRNFQRLGDTVHLAEVGVLAGAGGAFKTQLEKLIKDSKSLTAKDAATLATQTEELRKKAEMISDDVEADLKKKSDIGRIADEILAIGITILDTLAPLAESDTKTVLTTYARNYADIEKNLKNYKGEDARDFLFDTRKTVNTHLKQAQVLRLEEALAEPDGARNIDRMIGAFKGKTRRPEDDAICRAAIEVRFGKTLDIQAGRQTVKLPKLYELLAAVPTGHVLDNGSLTGIEFKLEPASAHNYYSTDRKTIALNAMEETEEGTDFQPDQGGKFRSTYYDATTLHEVGHAVDDKFGFMNEKKTLAGYGQWQEHSLSDVAKAYCTHGKKGGIVLRLASKGATEADLQTYLSEALQAVTSKKPTGSADPLGSLLACWDDLDKDQTVVVCRKLAVQFQPWDGGKTLATEAATGGRVYFEGYPGEWYSYAVAERAKTGVSTYQWRSPMEWFAELYAVYYLKPGAFPDIMLKKWLAGQSPA